MEVYVKVARMGLLAEPVIQTVKPVIIVIILNVATGLTGNRVAATLAKAGRGFHVLIIIAAMVS